MTCPHCGLALPRVKRCTDTYYKDRKRAETAIGVLNRALTNPFWQNIIPAIHDEITRLTNWLDDPDKLRMIYHRNSTR
jgi:hypothetical protein